MRKLIGAALLLAVSGPALAWQADPRDDRRGGWEADARDDRDEPDAFGRGPADGRFVPPPRAPLTRDGVRSLVRETFASVDRDRDGSVTREEAERYADDRAVRVERFRVERRAPSFDEMDADGDGRITRREFDAFHARRETDGPVFGRGEPDEAGDGPFARRREVIIQRRGDAPGSRRFGMGAMGPAMFDRLDANGDGRVILREAEDGALARFDRADADGDGVLEAGEAGPRVRVFRMDRRERPSEE